MPIGLLSNLNTAFCFGFPRAARVKLYQPLHFIETLFFQNCSNSSCTKIMATCSIVAHGDVVVDTSLSSYGSLSSFVKPGGVHFGNRSHKVCGRAKLSLTNVATGSRIFSDFERSSIRSFSSSCYSDHVVPEELPSVAISDKETSIHSTLKLLSGACYLPHPAKESTGGEDAHFICADEQVIGVADGVGGWADVGVNAGIYARELMSNAVEAIRKVPDDVDPFSVLEKAHAATNAMGSSTACIIALKNQDLHAINLGDSGFMIVRDGALIFESPVQQHGFNFTYQLERGNQGDLPSSGQVFKISVMSGDIVVAGSDGLFDNLYAKEIVSIVADAIKAQLSPSDTAKKIAAVARARALDMKHQTPFSVAAQEAGFSYYGGKLDDLTVVVSHVS
ncbi:probable protein phosphatase 2C 55 [Salvia miltiorrhiza]|uniref:probable protein phosphatase 2C 55 n=1 Tax=Salvia miltiorrhiza TaxID=226208 RepID=UPI0025AD68B3|nr:probable protein phosphatase 2C 55 [Salvia miltiorrhiza]XP_057769050.1 probable protein phosphatase 2C 55 [Salvia miltiorrhiza]XP_057769051.1 probable protein phosphatase 2C 55 [Salvia miltiorrhiza]